MDITVTVDNLDLTSVIPGQTRTYNPESDETEYSERTVGDAVARHIADELMRTDEYRSLKKRVLEIRDEQIREQVRPVVEAAIAAPVQETNRYGQPTGQPTSLTELILKEARAFLTKTEGYGGQSVSVVGKLVKDAVDQALRAELAAAIKEEKEKVVATVRARAAEMFAAGVMDGGRR